MTAALLWKEYRQQRAFWLVIAIMALVIVVGVAEAMGHGSGWEVFHDTRIRTPLIAVVVGLVLIHGVATGAMLLAGDKEAGALVFLDTLTGRRGPLFAAKIAAGVILTLLQCLALVALAGSLGFGSWELALYLPFMALEALAWGLLAGALCRTTLSALLVGVALMVCGQSLVALIGSLIILIVGPGPDPFALIVGTMAVEVAAGYASWRIFCRNDRTRRPERKWPKIKLLSPWISDCQVLLWLILRQCRWVLIACCVGAVAVGLAVQLSPLVVWPIGTLLLGLTCGLAAFAPDQSEGYKFLGAQRFPAGKVWTVKVLVWGTVLVVLTATAWLAAALTFGTWSTEFAWFPGHWINHWLSGSGRRYLYYPSLEFGNTWLFFGMWPLYGFCFGQFFGQLTRRPIVAVVLAGCIAPLVGALWTPSLFVGIVPLWQMLIVPFLLLLTTRLAQWPWVSGRLASAKSLLGVGGALTLMAASLAGCLWYRAVEVPDVGEPFDVKAFLDSLASPVENQAGRLLRSAVAEMEQSQKNMTVEPQVPPPQDVASPTFLANRVAATGWSKKDEKEIGPWLDLLFEEEWAKKAQKAAHLPQGMVRDPRITDLPALMQESYQRYSDLGDLFVARALQLQARGDSQNALRHLETVLALSRQVKNCASGWLLYCSFRMEYSALAGMRRWLQEVGPDKELLQAARAVLDRHNKDSPDPANAIKANYVIYCNGGQPSFSGETRLAEFIDVVYRVPWERQRQDRILRALVMGGLRVMGEGVEKHYGYFKQVRGLVDEDRLLLNAAMNGLPPKDGPGSSVGSKQWGEFIRECWFRKELLAVYTPQIYLPALELIVALALYQADRGRLPTKLEDLVPAYLPKLPIDPAGAASFRFGISEGEEIDRPNEPPLRLQRGQAFILNADGDYYPVPFLPKQKEDQP
jgi:hypothetical protein